MNWVNIAIIALGLILGYSKQRGQNAQSSSPAKSSKKDKTDGNKPEGPWRSNNLDELIDASKIPLDPLQRHLLLTKILKVTYKQRTDVSMLKIFKRFARIHLNEFADLAPTLKSNNGGSLPNIATFKLSVKVFEEEENYPAAMTICNMALEYGIDDGTKSGFKGRLKRLQKKQSVQQL